MKIPIKVEYFAGGLRPIITFCLKSTEPNIFGFVNAIVDTGSPVTILGALDVKRMRISSIQLAKLIGPKEEVSLGGVQMKTQILPEANIKIGSYVNIIIPIKVPVEVVRGGTPPQALLV